MGIGEKGKGLIFIISQPRSGSTLLQRILGGHPAIHTTQETWLMIPALLGLTCRWLSQEGREALAARNNIKQLLNTFPNGEDVYLEGVRLMCKHIYSHALGEAEKHYFIDKTPRYSYFIPDLYKVFPEAHYIILLRNPLSVLCSIIKRWTKHDMHVFSTVKDDLDIVPRLLIQWQKLLGEKAISVKYEKLAYDPEFEIKRICSILGIEYLPEMLEYGENDLPHWNFGDDSVYQYSRPSIERVNDWISDIKDPFIWRLAHSYLARLGKDTVYNLGYSFEELDQTLKKNKPNGLALLLAKLAG